MNQQYNLRVVDPDGGSRSIVLQAIWQDISGRWHYSPSAGRQEQLNGRRLPTGETIYWTTNSTLNHETREGLLDLIAGQATHDPEPNVSVTSRLVSPVSADPAVYVVVPSVAESIDKMIRLEKKPVTRKGVNDLLKLYGLPFAIKSWVKRRQRRYIILDVNINTFEIIHDGRTFADGRTPPDAFRMSDKRIDASIELNLASISTGGNDTCFGFVKKILNCLCNYEVYLDYHVNQRTYLKGFDHALNYNWLTKVGLFYDQLVQSVQNADLFTKHSFIKRCAAGYVSHPMIYLDVLRSIKNWIDKFDPIKEIDILTGIASIDMNVGDHPDIFERYKYLFEDAYRGSGNSRYIRQILNSDYEKNLPVQIKESAESGALQKINWFDNLAQSLPT